jgi:glycine dehydrogenase subunit 2
MRFERYDKLIFDLTSPGRVGARPPEMTVPEDSSILEISKLLREDLPLPEVAEPEVVRHYVALSRKNYHIDQGFYPLGSCTMKYNPKANEDAAAMPGFSALHPLTPDMKAQGALALMHSLGEMLLDLTGFDDLTLQPAAGAHGELTALMMIKAHFAEKGQPRDEVLCPDSAHGTNPASAAMVGMKVREIKSNASGTVDIAHLRELLSDKTACVMITNPNTLGIFEAEILEITKLVHQHGAFVYMDGANMNALLGRARPGDMGFDVMHLNLHKTFSTPHGGGGPGAGPVLVKKTLAPYLPVPRIEKQGGNRGDSAGGRPIKPTYRWAYGYPQSIGKVHGQYGNFGMLVRAYTYILSFGMEGLTRISGIAVLNANYLREKLKSGFSLPYAADRCMHEFVLSGTPLKERGLRTMDVAKRLLDYGFHAPTIYFPLIVDEALMIEPTESESKETLDLFVDAMRAILRECDENPDLVHNAPHTTPVRRLDETKAARSPVLKVQDVNAPPGRAAAPPRRSGPGCPVQS